MTASVFEFEQAGKKFSIPLFADVPMGALRRARKDQEDSEKVFTILEFMFPDDSKELKAIDSMNAAEFGKFLDSWTQGAQLGESSSSES